MTSPLPASVSLSIWKLVGFYHVPYGLGPTDLSKEGVSVASGTPSQLRGEAGCHLGALRPVPLALATPGLTRTAAWTVARGSPTRLVPLMAVRRSPMLRAPERSAGPPCSKLAMTAVGSKEPQPDSTRATPKPSPRRFSMTTWKRTWVGHEGHLVGDWQGVTHLPAHLPAVLAVGEVVEVSIVEVARACGPLAWLDAHLAGVNAAFLQELAICHREGLADGLSNELGLWKMGSISLGVSHPLPSGPPNPLTSQSPALLPHPEQDSQGTRFWENTHCLGESVERGKPGTVKV